ncbi:hypothetical protein J2Y48_001941 [Mycoplana sp. BE70]|nr:hypothetical protein [Mycoplana sp. BE70]MDR6756648.1 hypothetical protein [Mycoplana sp. BE70]
MTPDSRFPDRHQNSKHRKIHTELNHTNRAWYDGITPRQPLPEHLCTLR